MSKKKGKPAEGDKGQQVTLAAMRPPISKRELIDALVQVEYDRRRKAHEDALAEIEGLEARVETQAWDEVRKHLREQVKEGTCPQQLEEDVSTAFFYGSGPNVPCIRYSASFRQSDGLHQMVLRLNELRNIVRHGYPNIKEIRKEITHRVRNGFAAQDDERVRRLLEIPGVVKQLEDILDGKAAGQQRQLAAAV